MSASVTLRAVGDLLLPLLVAAIFFWAASKAWDVVKAFVFAVVLFVLLVGLENATATLDAVRRWIAP